MIGGPKSRSLRKLRSIELSVVARDAHGPSVGYRLSRRLQRLFVFIFVCSLVLATLAVAGSPTSAQEVDNETDLNALFEGFDDLPADDSDPLAGLEADLEAGIDSPAGEGTVEELPEEPIDKRSRRGNRHGAQLDCGPESTGRSWHLHYLTEHDLGFHRMVGLRVLH